MTQRLLTARIYYPALEVFGPCPRLRGGVVRCRFGQGVHLARALLGGDSNTAVTFLCSFKLQLT